MSDPGDEAIRAAIQRGEFDNLKNKGKKLNLDDYFATPEDVRVGYSVLKGAEYVPEEITLLKEIGELKEQLSAERDEQKRKTLQRDIHDRQLKYNILMDRLQKYR